MPADPTDADRERARKALGYERMGMGVRVPSWVVADVDAVAAALAGERERARAPFLALADEIDGLGDMDAGGIAQEIRDIAAQESTP